MLILGIVSRANQVNGQGLRQAPDILLGKATMRHDHPPTGLQAAGMKLDLEVHPWLHSYSYKQLDDDEEVVLSML
jgi:hypothetical protein